MSAACDVDTLEMAKEWADDEAGVCLRWKYMYVKVKITNRWRRGEDGGGRSFEPRPSMGFWVS